MFESEIQGLEATLEIPVILVASNWRRERAVDLDEVAARAFWEVLEAVGMHEGGDSSRAQRLAVVAVGRGGTAEFVDGVVRVLRGHGVELQVWVPRRITGALTSLALAADELILSACGALGAYDVGTCAESLGRIDLETIEAFAQTTAAEHVGPAEVGRFGEAAHERNLARTVARRVLGEREPDAAERIAEALSVQRLGRQLGLHAEELGELGLPVRETGAEEREGLEALCRAVEEEFELRGAAPQRYEEDGPGGEVQFEPAETVASAVVASAGKAFVYEMDTGKPHPDTNVYEGEWVER